MTLSAPPARPRNPVSAVSLRQSFGALLWVIGYVFAAAAIGVGLHLVGLLDLRSVLGDISLLTLLTLAALLATYLHVLKRDWSRLRLLGFARPGWRFLHLLWQVPLAMGSALLVEAVTVRAVTGGSAPPDRSGDVLSDLLALPVPAVVLVFAVVSVATPLWEETLFRGAILLGFVRRFGPAAAVLLTAAVFAAVHVAPLVLPYVFVLGLALGWIRWFHRNLWASVTTHAVNNAVSLLVVLSAT